MNRVGMLGAVFLLGIMVGGLLIPLMNLRERTMMRQPVAHELSAIKKINPQTGKQMADCAPVNPETAPAGSVDGFLQNIPLAVLSEVLDKRVNEANEALKEKFPEIADPLALRDLKEKVRHDVKPLLEESPYWSAQTILALPGGAEEVEFALHLYPGDASGADAGPARPSEKDETCYFLQGYFPKHPSQRGSIGESGCSNGLRRGENRYSLVFSTLNADADTIRDVSHIAVDIPSVGKHSGIIEMASGTRKKWLAEQSEIRWSPISKEKYEQLRGKYEKGE